MVLEFKSPNKGWVSKADTLKKGIFLDLAKGRVFYL